FGKILFAIGALGTVKTVHNISFRKNGKILYIKLLYFFRRIKANFFKKVNKCFTLATKKLLAPAKNKQTRGTMLKKSTYMILVIILVILSYI
ncbi:MAG: hypothetical protein IJP05_01670, partial [Oscillospiraceae bacterium]|nr:hypothetical protein [Oscillospiraceae bacterium]